MIFSQSLRILLAVKPCDLRKSFDSPGAVVRNELRQDPLSRQLFVFLNRAADRVKILYWDGTGFWVLAKRLEKGRFSRPSGAAAGAASIILRPEALDMLLQGIDLRGGMRRPWYEEPEKIEKSAN